MRDWILLLGSTMRLTRLIVKDDLGAWLVRHPAWEWAQPGEMPPHHLQTLGGHLSRTNLISGLECPFCVGFWIGTANLAAMLISRRRPSSRAAWRFMAAAFTLNEIAAHLGARLGDTASEE